MPAEFRESRPETGSALLSVREIRKGYPTGRGDYLPVLKSVTFDVAAGEVVAIVGESGTGKSTLLHLIGTLDRPDGGSIVIGGRDIFAQRDARLAAFRNAAVGFVFQFHHLLPEFTAAENVAMPALIGGMAMAPARMRALELLDQLGLSERAEHRPAELSGGEQQRVAVARALVNKPGLVLADEPTGNLDARTADALHHEILRLSRAFGQTFLLVTHNLALASLCDRVLRLEGGVVHG